MKVIQVLNALDYGDGVCNDAYHIRDLLIKMGYQTEIYSRYVHEKCKRDAKDISLLKADRDDIIIHHFAGESVVHEEVFACNCRKILRYHNVTPDIFMQGEVTEITAAEKQLLTIWQNYDYLIAVSEFNKQCMQNLGVTGEIAVVPILMKFDKFANLTPLYHRRKRFLAVGRIARNKKCEDTIKIFEQYYSNFDVDSELYFVGNYQGYEDYYEELKQLLNSCKCKNRVHFTGKVSDQELYDYYRSSDIFICMSEHEGFCIPLIESMAMKLPTIAYDACAVKDTMGDAGVLVKDKDYLTIAKLCYMILHNRDMKEQMIDRQCNWISNFSEESIENKLKEIFERVKK